MPGASAQRQWALCTSTPRLNPDRDVTHDCEAVRAAVSASSNNAANSWSRRAVYCGEQPPGEIVLPPVTPLGSLTYVCFRTTSRNDPIITLNGLWSAAADAQASMHQAPNAFAEAFVRMFDTASNGQQAPRVMWVQLSDEPFDITRVAPAAQSSVKDWAVALQQPNAAFAPPPPQTNVRIGAVLQGSSAVSATAGDSAIAGGRRRLASSRKINPSSTSSTSSSLSSLSSTSSLSSSSSSLSSSLSSLSSSSSSGRSLHWLGDPVRGQQPLDYATYRGLSTFVPEAHHLLISPNSTLPDYMLAAPQLYTYVGAYLVPSFEEDFLFSGEASELALSLRDFVTRGGILLAAATVKDDLRSMEDSCKAPLALVDTVLGDGGSGCDCADPWVYDARYGAATARLDTAAVEAVWGVDGGAPLLALDENYDMDVRAVGGLPLNCAFGGGTGIFEMYWSELGPDGQPTDEDPTPTSNSLVKVWQLGRGLIVYMGSGVFPIDQTFNTPSLNTDEDYYRALFQVVFRTGFTDNPPPPPPPPPPPAFAKKQ